MEIKPRFLGTDTTRIERLSGKIDKLQGAENEVQGFDERPVARVWVGNEAPMEPCQGWLRSESGDHHWCTCVEEARLQRQAHGLLFVGMSHVARTAGVPTLHCLVDVHGHALTFSSEREMENYAIELIADLQELP